MCVNREDVSQERGNGTVNMRRTQSDSRGKDVCANIREYCFSY